MLKFLEEIFAHLWNWVRWRKERAAKRSSGSLVLGFRVVEGEVTKQPVTISLTRRATHTAVFGRTGSGKTYGAKFCMAQDVKADRGGFYADPHGDITPFLLGAIAERERQEQIELAHRVVVISPSDPEVSVGLNPLEGLANDFVRSTEFAELLRQRYNIDAFGARTEELLRNGIVVLSDNNLTLIELALLLSNDRFRSACLRNTRNAEVKEYFESRFGKVSEPMKATMREPILNKISAFTADPRFRHIVGQAHSTFSMKDMIDRKCWVIAYVPKGALGAQAVTFLGMLFAIFKSAIFSRDRRSFYPAYFDEFQNLVGQSADVETVFSEARKFGVGVTAVNQFLDQFPASMRAALLSIGNHISFQLSSVDAATVSQMFDGGKPLAEKLKNLPPRHFIVKSGSDHWLEGCVPTVEEPSANYIDLLRRSRAIYARPRGEVEKEIAARRQAFASNPEEVLHDWD